MKKLIAIICILLVIFISMFIYKINLKQNKVNVLEVSQIQEYISKIYMWQEITGEALPRFENINDAPEEWIWEVVKQHFDKYELTYEEIQEKAIEIFGTNFTKQFPREGIEFIYYDENYGKYLTSGMGLDMLEDSFFIRDIKKTSNNKYEVEIVEYLEDYSETMEIEEATYDVYIKNLNQETIATVKNTDSETNVIEIVKENIEKFSTKKIELAENGGKLYVESVK